MHSPGPLSHGLPPSPATMAATSQSCNFFHPRKEASNADIKAVKVLASELQDAWNSRPNVSDKGRRDEWELRFSRRLGVFMFRFAESVKIPAISPLLSSLMTLWNKRQSLYDTSAPYDFRYSDLDEEPFRAELKYLPPFPVDQNFEMTNNPREGYRIWWADLGELSVTHPLIMQLS